MTASDTLEIELGPEWDSALLARLRATIIAAGGTMTESSWGVGGSQEVGEFQIQLPSGSLEAMSETYMGLTLRGPAQLVQEIANAVAKTPAT